MKYLSLILALSCLSHWASPSSGSVTSALRYEVKTKNLKKCIDGACASVDLTYPVFEGNSSLAITLNRQVAEQNMVMWMTDEQPDETVDEAIASFFEDYEQFREDFPDAAHEWFFETEAKVTFQSDSLISIKFENFWYMGGAHPNTLETYLNLDLSEAGTILTHEKMLTDREKLLKLAEEKFRKQHEVSVGVSLEEDGRFFLEEEEFFLPLSMGYEDNEFVLIYNNYEIGPYAMGRTDLRFPFKDIKGIVFDPE